MNLTVNFKHLFLEDYNSTISLSVKSLKKIVKNGIAKYGKVYI